MISTVINTATAINSLPDENNTKAMMIVVPKIKNPHQLGPRNSDMPMSIQRIIASRIFNTWIKMTLQLKHQDAQCGAKIFRSQAIKKVLPHLSVLEYAVDVDLLYTLKKLGFKTHEVPTVWSDKNYSKINFTQSGPKMALTVLKLRLINSPLKIFFKRDKQ